MFVAYSKDLLYMLCVTAFCQSRIKSVCRDDCVLRCNTVPFGRWLPVFVATQCLHFQGWRVSYILKAGVFFCSYEMFVPAYQTTWCHTVEHHSVHFSLPWDVTSQIDEFIQQRPGNNVRLLRYDLNSSNKKVHLIGIRLFKKHRPCFVAEWHCGQYEAGCRQIKNLVPHHKQKKWAWGCICVMCCSIYLLCLVQFYQWAVFLVIFVSFCSVSSSSWSLSS
jgi:hypothetical protein